MIGPGSIERGDPYPDASTASGFAPTDKYSPLIFQPDDGYANGQDDASRTVPVHDASAGAVPSFTTARKRSIAVVSVTGTLRGVTVARGDLLMANRDNPTTAAHWDIIRDCAAEFELAVEEAAGSPLEMNGTYLMRSANPDAQINLTGNFYIFNNLNLPAIHQLANATYAANTTTQCQVSAMAKANYTEPNTGTSMQRGTRFTLSTTADADNFSVGQMMLAYCDVATPNSAGSSSKEWLKEAFRIQAIDAANGYIFADKVLRWHTEMAAATAIYINSINSDRAMIISGDATIGGAPTFVGESLGWWKTLRGDQVTATITGNSGSSRTISRTGHKLTTNDSVQVGTVSGTLHTTCRVASVIDADTFTITVPSTQDYSGSSPSIGTSGTLYYAPAFVVTDTTHLGGALIAEHANGSRINIKANKLWAAGVRLRNSNYCRIAVEGFNNNDPYTDNNNTSGRLVYLTEDYVGSENVFDPKGKGGRHAFTGNGNSTSQAFSASRWYDRGGNSVNARVYLREEGADGGGSDTHSGANGTQIHSVAHNPSRLAFEGSYQGFYGNVRGSNEIRIGRQVGGYEGIVFRAFENQAGSIHQIDLDFSDIPYVNSNTMAVRTESLAAITNKFRVIGRLGIKNCGRGFRIESDHDFSLTEFTHKDIAYAAGYIKGNSKFHADTCNLGYASNTAGQSTRYGFLMDGTTMLDFGILNVTMGPSANPAELFVDNDAASGKIITIGILNISDPYAVGMPDILESGAEANFTLNIGMTIYNGAVVE